MVERLFLFVALFAFWVLLSGFFTPFLLTAGLGSAAAVVWFSSRFLGVVDREAVPVHLTRNALVYWPWLLWEIAKSAWDVTKRIVDPALPISPTLIRVRPTQRSDLGRVIYANSITLTPGTITIELEVDEILVHSLTREGADGLAGGDMDRRVTLFAAT